MHDPVDDAGRVGIGDDQVGVFDGLAQFIVDIAGQRVANAKAQRIALELAETEDCHRHLHAASIAFGVGAGIP